MKKIAIFTMLNMILVTAPCLAGMNVVATLPWIGSIAKEIGKEKIEVTVLVKPGQDPHQIEAKPSMILAARKAEMLMYNGLDLEIGYLPVLIESSRNPKIQSGTPGNFDCSAYVSVIEKPSSVDRSLGDVHPLGNPHYHLSPSNIRRVADGMARALSGLDQANSDFYKANVVAFRKQLDEKEKEWGQKPLTGRKFISYHKLFEYMAREFGFDIVAYVESKPGIPPSASHIEKLIDVAKKAKPDAILTTAYHGRRETDVLSKKTGVKVVLVPHEVGCVPQAKDWFSLMDEVVTSLK